MVLARFNGLAQDDQGNALSGVTVEVRDENTGLLASLFSGRDGTPEQSIGNPFVSADPNFFFHVRGGNYHITASRGSLQRTWRWTPVGTMQSEDFEDVAISLQAGIIPALTLAELELLAPSVPEGETEGPPTAGVVYADPDPANNGYYVYNYNLEEWTWARPLPDTLATLGLESSSDNELIMQSSPAVNPAAVRAYVVDVGEWENTGPVTISIDGAAAIPARDVNDDEFLPGVFTGRLFLTNEGDHLRAVVGGDVMAAAAAAQGYATQAGEFSELSEAWAEGTEPGGPGTKSSREYAEEAGDIVTDFSLSAVPVGFIAQCDSDYVPAGWIRYGEGGTYDTGVYPDLAVWMAANHPELAAGELPDYRDRVARTIGTYAPAVGEAQEDAGQRITGSVGIRSGNNAGNANAEPVSGGGALDATTQTGRSAVGTTYTAVTVAFDTVTFDSGNSPGAKVSDVETRVKSFGIRWIIKAYDAFINQATADLVAMEQAVAGAVRFDVPQAPGDGGALARSNIGAASDLVFIARDEKANSVAGGTSSAGGNIRDLNTVIRNTIPGASLSSNGITLPAGTYEVFASAPAYRVGTHKLYLRMVNSPFTILATGLSSYTGVGDQVSTRSSVRIILVLSEVTPFYLLHNTAAVQELNGLGVPTTIGQPEVYSEVEIRKLA